MTHSAYTHDDFHAALRSLMPRGRVWNWSPDAVMDQTLGCFAPSFARSGGDALALIADAFPATALDLLPEWEASLGLPDGCLPRDGTLVSRRQAVLAKLNATGGQSIAYFCDLAADLGYPGAWVEQFYPFTAVSPCIDALNTDPWCFVWVLHVPQLPPGNAATDHALECLVHRYKPAHTYVYVVYSADLYVYAGYVDPGYFVGDP